MQPGERIDHYRLVSLVGAGGMGEVYRAIDERLQRDVAIKVLPHSRGRAHREARLLREAQAASHLNHPGIVTIHDVGRWGDRTYIVMELVDGRRLSELAQTPLGAAQAVALCRQAAEAMAVAHERGILHRDIKPDNLMVTRDDRVKILDFGVAKVYDPSSSLELGSDLEAEPPAEAVGPEDDTEPAGPAPLEGVPPVGETIALHPGTPATISVTRTGALLGTPSYMSPEQAAGAPVDERSEVYSLGLVLYELLTGIRPLQRGTLLDTLAAARDPAIAPPSAAARGRRDVPRRCDRLLARALARAPADRHPTMRALADDLRAVEQSLARPQPRRWLPIALTAVLAAGAAAVSLVWLERGGSPRAAGAPPIETTRVTRLTFDPGCEELPTFWPDGGSVVFDGVVDGDTELVRIDLATGARQRLTRNPGWDLGAAVSPDGRQLAFIRFTDRGRELMVMPVGEDGAAGEARPLGVTRGYPRWSRSGGVLAGDDLSTVRRFDPAGGRSELVASANGYIAIEIEEMAGGELLVSLRHSAQDPGRVALGLVRGGQIELVGDIMPLDPTGIERDAAGRGFYSGETTVRGPRLFWRALDGSAREEVDNIPFPFGGIAADSSGRRLVVSTCRQLFRIGRIEGGRFSPLFAAHDWSDAHVAAVGDGSFVFASDRSGQTQLWTGRPDQAPRPLIAEPSASPAVSPDRRQLLYVATAPERRGIYLSGIDGSGARALTRNDTDDHPAFSRDGAHIYFMRAGQLGPRVFRMPVAGGDAVPLTDGGVIVFDLSPVAERMAWVFQQASGRRVAIGEPGGNFTLIESLPPGNYTEVAFSADGKKLWVGRGANELVELRGDGSGQPKTIWHTTNDLVGFIAADAGGLLAEVATYDGDLYLVEGRFR